MNIVKNDMAIQPHSGEPIDLEPAIRLIAKVAGVYLFSAAQLHSTVTNTSSVTRDIIDFRTVNIYDVCSRGGAPNIAFARTGTTMRDYLRASDLQHIREDIVALYDTDNIVNIH